MLTLTVLRGERLPTEAEGILEDGGAVPSDELAWWEPPLDDGDDNEDQDGGRGNGEEGDEEVEEEVEEGEEEEEEEEKGTRRDGRDEEAGWFDLTSNVGGEEDVLDLVSDSDEGGDGCGDWGQRQGQPNIVDLTSDGEEGGQEEKEDGRESRGESHLRAGEITEEQDRVTPPVPLL